MQETGNKQYKDTIFRTLFLDKKNFTELYYDITNEQLKPDDIKVYTVDSLVATQLKNDVSFKTKDNRFIIMVEHQSTLNYNMALRALIYYVELLKIYIKEEKIGIQLYQESPISIPAAEIYVAYNGEKQLEDDIITLSNHFTKGNQSCVNVEVKVVDIEYDRLPEQIAEKNDTLTGYSYLINRISFYRKQGKSINEALEQAKRDTLAKGLLTKYLNEKEFLDMATEIITIEEQIALTEQAGFIKGKAEGKAEIAQKAIKEGLPFDMITMLTGLSIEDIEQLSRKLKN